MNRGYEGGEFVASKEEVYKAQLIELGIYEEAYNSAIKELCMIERELSRARKNLKAKHTGPDKKVDEYAYFTDPLYGVVKQLHASALAYKDALGLTPKALKKLKGKTHVGRQAPMQIETPLSLLTTRRNERKSSPPA